MWLKPRNKKKMFISSEIFKGIDSAALEEFKLLNAIRVESFGKDETILHAGDVTERIGIVQKGMILIENIDPWGKRSILNILGEGNVFAESYALSSSELMVDVISKDESTILFINIKKLLCDKNREKIWYSKLLFNLLYVTSSKNMVLSTRIFTITPKTIRARLLRYLSTLYAKNGSASFTVPFNREGMAEYLNTERTALSKELGKMKKDGLISWHKNQFQLLIPPSDI